MNRFTPPVEPSVDEPQPSPLASPQPGAASGARIILHTVLLAVTFLTTTLAGFFLHLDFLASSGQNPAVGLLDLVTNPSVIRLGLPFSGAILAILLAHELGHFLTCRFYGIAATLPFVIPAPPPLIPFGTLGAVIKIKSVFRNRSQLFDVGIAGPIAGFLLILPVTIVGIRYSVDFVAPEDLEWTLEFGEPLLFQLGTALFYPGGSTSSITLHPVGFAAWFGMLATSLNLLPIGQLDGGHIVYALFGPKGHRIISYCTFAGLLILSLSSWPMLGYLFFALILVLLRFRHPRPLIDLPVRSRGRLLLALGALAIFILTFIPVPVRIVEHVGRL